MSGQAVVSPLPHGAARHIEYSRDVESAASPSNGSAHFSRGGPTLNQNYQSSGGDAFSGSDSAYNAANNSKADRWAWVRGRYAMSPGAAPIITRPTAKFKWPLGVRVCEGVIMYALGGTNGANEDPAIIDANRFSGIAFMTEMKDIIGVGAPAYNVTHGFGVGGNLGSLWWTSRGPAGLERINLSNIAALGVAPLSTPNKFRMEIRNATSTSDASVTLYINDVFAFTKYWRADNSDYLPRVQTYNPAGRLEQIWMHLPGGSAAAPAGSTLLLRDIVNYKAPDIPGV